MASLSRRLGLWGPVAAWMGLIFLVSSLSRPPGAGLLPDWVTHPCAYAILAALLARALAGGLRPHPPVLAAAAAALATLYGAADEWHQMHVPERKAEVADVMKDLGGAVAGAALFRALAGRLGRAEVTT